MAKVGAIAKDLEEDRGGTISITCPRCKRRYRIDEQQIPSLERITARCKACGYRFPVPFPSSPENQTSGNKQGQVLEFRPPARTIGVSLSKGGVGKTTTAVNLSTGLALAGFRVLLVDTDTQGQDAYMLGIKPKACLTEFLMEESSADEILVKARENLWLLAGGKSLAGVKRIIDRKSFGGELTLAEALKPLESRYDFIIVDSSPGWDPLTVNVLFYVKELLVPVSLEVMSLQGLAEFQKSISSIRKYRKEISLKYILPTFLDKRIESPGVLLSKLKDLYGDLVCAPIRYDSFFANAPAFGKTIYEFAPGSKGAEDYRGLVRKIARRSDILR